MRASCIKQLHCFTEKMCVIQAFCFVTSGLLRRFAPRNDGICALTAVLITPYLKQGQAYNIEYKSIASNS